MKKYIVLVLLLFAQGLLAEDTSNTSNNQIAFI